MKTQNTHAQFNKQSIVELDIAKLSNINGGSSPACLPSIIIIIPDIL